MISSIGDRRDSRCSLHQPTVWPRLNDCPLPGTDHVYGALPVGMVIKLSSKCFSVGWQSPGPHPGISYSTQSSTREQDWLETISFDRLRIAFKAIMRKDTSRHVQKICQTILLVLANLVICHKSFCFPRSPTASSMNST